MSLDAVGGQLSHYAILRLLGEGGMGRIYLARDTRLDRNVALKVLRPEAVGDPDRRRRFIREAKAASALNHPHIVTVHEIASADTPDGPIEFMAMEYIAGGSLADRLRVPLPVEDAVRYAAEIADALAAAHDAGIVHRDIKPANVMITAGGAAKVVDFGIVKLAEPVTSDAQTTMGVTHAGAVIGTVSYMAPEQAAGGPVDGRADIFALGVVLYEMLAGRRPFDRDSPVSTLSALLKGEYVPLSLGCVDADVGRIASRCLEVDPALRYQSARELADDLRACLTRRRVSPAPPTSSLRRPAILWAAAAALIATFVVGGWLWVRAERVRHARLVVLPEIERLAADSHYLAALQLAEQHERYLADDPVLAKLWQVIAMPVTVRATPDGARMSMRGYADGPDRWIALGVLPLVNRRLPFGHVRFRIEKDGYEPLEWTSAILAPELHFTLAPRSGEHSGMVAVPGGRYTIAQAQPVPLQDFWIDRHEVTNREFKRFVDAGGYRRRELWNHEFVDAGRRVPWDAAIARFRDRTGRPGPSTWELGTFPDGQDGFPVSGVSWYEAAAYAEFAGKSLPTIYHWYKAAGMGAGIAFFSDIVGMSNFASAGPVPVGSGGGVSAYGAHDMAGNVKEWCLNDAGGGRRYSLGGGWGEPTYLFRGADAHAPFERGPTFGFRCVKYGRQPETATAAPVVELERDFSKERPASDEVFAAYAAMFTYGPSDLDGRVESSDDTSALYRRERITFNAAYGTERVPAWLFVPRHGTPPYQTLVYFPSGEALDSATSENAHRDWRLEFVLRSGRALIHPIYAGTYERRAAGRGGAPGTGRIRQLQDLSRSIDYLQTRREFDTSKLAYYGVSYGAQSSPIMLALEKRFKTAVLLWGGFHRRLDGINEALHYAPRVTLPVLMVNGRHDFIFPVNTSQIPLLEAFGTPKRDKRHVLFDYGHIPPKNTETMKEVVDWLDRHLGPVGDASRQ